MILGVMGAWWVVVGNYSGSTRELVSTRELLRESETQLS